MKKIVKRELAVNLKVQTLTVPVNTQLLRVGLDPNTKTPVLNTLHREIDEDETKELKVKFVLNDKQFGNESRYIGTVIVKQGDGTFLELHLVEDFSDE